MMEVILETGDAPVDPCTRQRLVKTRIQDSLVNHLAGRVTLSQFHRLIRELNRWFPRYYPMITAAAPQTVTPASCPAGPAPRLTAQVAPAKAAVQGDRLLDWLNHQGRALLPRRPHRKLDLGKLWHFLVGTQGGWFRLKDFEEHFAVDRKTAWEYLIKLLHAGLLRHNRRRSVAVRYALAASFLAVRADALETAVQEGLAGLPSLLPEPVSDWLIATGGEPFWENEWSNHLEPAWRRLVLTRLQAAGVLQALGQVRDNRLLRIAPAWLRG